MSCDWNAHMEKRGKFYPSLTGFLQSWLRLQVIFPMGFCTPKMWCASHAFFCLCPPLTVLPHVAAAPGGMCQSMVRTLKTVHQPPLPNQPRNKPRQIRITFGGNQNSLILTYTDWYLCWEHGEWGWVYPQQVSHHHQAVLVWSACWRKGMPLRKTWTGLRGVPMRNPWNSARPSAKSCPWVGNNPRHR